MDRDASFSNKASRSTSTRLSLGISGPALDRARARHEIEPTHEIEAKYFIPNGVLVPLLQGRSFTKIEQMYFPKDRVRAIVEEFKFLLKVSDPESFSSARIRKTQSPRGRIEYFIEAKGKKEGEGDSRISRRESTARIPQHTYEKLREVASAGTLIKRRYVINGSLRTEREVHPLTAQIDVLQVAGKKPERLKVNVSTVDIELAHVSQIRALRAGDHSFSFLKRCIELTAKNPEEQKILATRLIAKRGLGDDQLKFLERLENEAKELR